MLRGKYLKKIVTVVLIVMLFIQPCMESRHIAYAQTDITLPEYEDKINSYSVDESVPRYEDYLAKNDTSRPDKQIEINAADYVRTEGMEVTKQQDYEGMAGTSVYTEDSGLIEYEVNVEEAGLYNMSLLYYPVEGKNTNIQRSIFIDGALPYRQMSLVEFSRIWENSSNEWIKDNQGNDLKPEQVERPDWITSYVYDSDGYVTEPLSVYLAKGVHTITLVSLREPMILRSIILDNQEQNVSYSEQQSAWNDAGAKDSSGQMVTLEGECANRKSSQMLYPQQDTSSPSVSPYSAKMLKNNYIGGKSWSTVGDWIEWDFEVEQSGYYNIALHDRQNLVKGIYSSRKIMIDGKVPFRELADYGFKYKSSWRVDTLQDKNGKPYKIYLEKGKHTIRMQAVLGDFSKIISEVEDAVTGLNEVYREVIKITGTTPTSDRDYQIESSLPDLKGELVTVQDKLDKAIKDLKATAGRTSDKETVLLTMRSQLGELIKNQERFANVMASFKINLRAVGNWVATSIDQPLSVDKIYIYSPDKKIEKLHDSWVDQLIHEIKKLFYSFIIDYNQIGNVADKKSKQESITLWIGTGRDQANVIKRMIDDNFTPSSNINVNVMLVDMSTLLKASLAGEGPDVAIQVMTTSGMSIGNTTTGTNVSISNDLPVNYGLRHAVADLTQFKDLDEVVKRFNSSAMESFQFNGATYALPETQTFPVMFYRKDIIKDLGIELPKTWDDMKVVQTVLNNNQMELGMIPGEAIFAMLLYQNGGQYYAEDGSYSMLDSDKAVDAFKMYCQLYTDYDLDKITSAEQRFRIGEAPIMIADYSVYNNLCVSAPDIKGLWGISQVPGVKKEDGTIDNSVASTGLASVIMQASEHKDASWEFLKWWSSAEVQEQYGKEMESLLGPAARVATANVEAFQNLPWNKADYNALFEQFKTVKGIPQVPGGYFTWRNINNAFYSVTNHVDTAAPREELMDKVLLIDDEITYKRDEFKLPTRQKQKGGE